MSSLQRDISDLDGQLEEKRSESEAIQDQLDAGTLTEEEALKQQQDITQEILDITNEISLKRARIHISQPDM